MYECEKGYVIVTDHIKANTGEDVSDALQELILANPHRTIYFPDGEYALSKPVCTPAHPEHSVALQLSNYAIIKPTAQWSGDEALIRLGGVDPYNSIGINGSNYYLSGGVIDGNGIAKGVSIDSGRETRVDGVSIKHTTVGLHIKLGANSGSSDADICNVNIVGLGKRDTIGVLIEGMDNTLTNMRIAYVHTGVKIVRGGNYLRNIHPLGTSVPEFYSDSTAFCDLSGSNWYDFCYSDQYETGFYFKGGCSPICHNCFCYWYKTLESGEIGFKTDGQFNALLSNCKVTLRGDAPNANFLVGAEGGYGVIENPFFDEKLSIDKCYQNYLVGKVLHP
jgi:hypothetical protein